MKNNIIQDKSYAFALKIIGLYKWLKQEKNEFVLSKQILRCGTSIGANIEEAIGGLSEKDFVSKIGIAYKEARETIYWIRLMRDSGYIDQETAKALLDDCEELQKIIGSIQKTIKSKNHNSKI
jgi:four helix bundle protein